MALSRKDQRVLNRLQLPTEQKALIEGYWSKTKSYFFTPIDLLLRGIPTAIALVFGYAHYAPAPHLVNIARFFTWIFGMASVMLFVAMLAIIALYRKKNDSAVLEREIIVTLPRGRSFLVRNYIRLVHLAVIVLAASLGYFITAFFYAACCLISVLLQNAGRDAVSETLKQMIAAKRREEGIATITEILPPLREGK